MQNFPIRRQKRTLLSAKHVLTLPAPLLVSGTWYLLVLFLFSQRFPIWWGLAYTDKNKKGIQSCILEFLHFQSSSIEN
jgi:hypothetical protein